MDTSLDVLGASGSPDAEDLPPSERLLREVLSVMRAHLRMEVAFISRIADGRQTFEHVDADPHFFPLPQGASIDVTDTFCARVLDGRVPSLIVDAGRDPELADLYPAGDFPIGTHLSVPVYNTDGGVFGTLCCFSRYVEPDLSDSDVRALRVFADIVSKHLEPLAAEQAAGRAAREHITRVLDEGTIKMALQPIVDLTTGRTVSYEALARFPRQLGPTPDRWFDAAGRAGMGTALESAAVHAALGLLPLLEPHQSLAINVSAAALLASASIPEMVTGPEGHRLVLELTEHQRLAEPELLAVPLARARRAGVRVAVDDAGSGYAGLEWILHLDPEVLKLDRSLVNGVAHHAGRQAMCEAMVGFTKRTGARLVAEGVETEADLATLRALGVTHAQGYLLGRPRVWA